MSVLAMSLQCHRGVVSVSAAPLVSLRCRRGRRFSCRSRDCRAGPGFQPVVKRLVAHSLVLRPATDFSAWPWLVWWRETGYLGIVRRRQYEILCRSSFGC